MLPCPTQTPTFCPYHFHDDFLHLPHTGCGQHGEVVIRPQPSRGCTLLQLQAGDNLRRGRGGVLQAACGPSVTVQCARHHVLSSTCHARSPSAPVVRHLDTPTSQTSRQIAWVARGQHAAQQEAFVCSAHPDNQSPQDVHQLPLIDCVAETCEPHEEQQAACCQQQPIAAFGEFGWCAPQSSSPLCAVCQMLGCSADGG